MATATRINDRYEKREVLGEGGMGVVWRAYDSILKREVTLKTIRDVQDKAALDLFRKECTVLAGMAHPNIVEIYDVGQTEDQGVFRPFFVMPLLRGVTLDRLIANSSERLTVERCVDMIMQVCRGLQAAHDRGLVHRDLKPSNLFILDDDSVKIIDFGVAHLVDTRTTVGIKGTLLYMAPEQIEMKKPTPLSDLFSLGIVAFEMMTRRRAFDGGSRDDLTQAILRDTPPPASQFNPNVSTAISQVIHKAMAKLPYQRFASVKEFGENLQKALHNEPIECFNPARIEPRIQRAQRALAQGELEFATEIISELESEAVLHPDLSPLRKQVESASRHRAVRQLLETARKRFEEEEYHLAIQKVQEVLNLEPTNTDAHALKGDIESKRSSQQIEDWYQLARQHMENHAYGHARQALQNVLQARPKEARVLQLLAEVDRRETEYQRLRQEKEASYGAALDALHKGDLSSALTKLERVLEMDRRAPDTFSQDRGAIYQKLYNEVRSERDVVNASYAEARKHLDNANFVAALSICQQYLDKYPEHAMFQSLKFDVETRQRQELSAYVARVGRDVDSEPDLNRKIRLLEEALALYPDEVHFQRSLQTVRAKRDLVDSIVTKARLLEERGQYSEALGQWEIVRNVYSQYPGIEIETDRVQRRKEQKDRGDVKARWIEQIDQALNVGEYSRAQDLCEAALGEFSSDPELLALEKAARSGAQRSSEAERILEDAETAIGESRKADALGLLRDAQKLDPSNAAIRQRLLDLLLSEAKLLIDANGAEAESYLDQALEIDPGNPLAKSLRTLLLDRRQEAYVTEVLSRARGVQMAGDLPGALSAVEEGLSRYPKDARLAQFRSAWKKNLQDAEKQDVRRRDFDEARTMARQAENEINPEALSSLFERTRALATRYPGDKDFETLCTEIGQRVEDHTVAITTDGGANGVAAPSPPKQEPSKPPAVPPINREELVRKAGAQARDLWAVALKGALSAKNTVTDVVGRILKGKYKEIDAKSIFTAAVVVTAILLFLISVVRMMLPTAPDKPAVAQQPGANTVRLVVSAMPSDATIQVLDSEQRSQSPNYVAPGDYLVRVSRRGYAPKEQKISAQPPGPVTLNFELDPLPSMLQVSTGLDSVTATLDGQPLENLSTDNLSNAEHTLVVSRANKPVASITFLARKAEAPEITQFTSQVRAVAARTFGGDVVVSSPADAKEKVAIGFDGSPPEEVGPEGLTRTGLAAGPRSMEVAAGGGTQPVMLDLTDGPKLVLFLPGDEEFGWVALSAGAQNVRVSLDGRTLNTQPMSQNRLGFQWKPGKYRLRIERDGYLPHEGDLVIQRAKLENVTVDLKPISRKGTVEITKVPADVQVAINDRPAQEPGADGRLAAELDAGSHRVRFLRRGYAPIQQEFAITVGRATAVDASKLTFKQLEYQISFAISPAKADIRITKPDRTEVRVSGSSSIALPDGVYRYRAAAEGYEERVDDLVVSGLPRTLSFELQPKTVQPAVAQEKPRGPMDGWTSAGTWRPTGDGWLQRDVDGQTFFGKGGSGVYSITVPCRTRVGGLFGSSCKADIYANYVDAKNYIQFVVTRNNLETITVKDGKASSINGRHNANISNELRVRVTANSEELRLDAGSGGSLTKIGGSANPGQNKGKFGLRSGKTVKDFSYSER